MKLLLKNGNLIDYATKKNEVSDILIEDGIIKEIGSITGEVENTIDCTGLNVIPGMVDMHCHLREPGFTHKETIETGAKSAAKGGFTTICPMPNTNPATDNAETINFVISKGKEVGVCNVLPYGAVTLGEKGETFTNFEELKQAGVVAFSDDGIPVKNSKIMRDAIIKSNELGMFVASHCEDKAFVLGKVNAGEVAKKLGAGEFLPEAETLMAAREASLAEINNCHVHICHVSNKETISVVRDAKNRGAKVTCEACTHHYSLTEEEVLEHGTNGIMNPPLRREEDRQAVIKGLQDGTIDCIITDHAPHSEEEKNVEFDKAPVGIIGFETALAASVTYLVGAGHISYLDMVKLTSYNPAKLLKIDKGTIQVRKSCRYNSIQSE